MTSHLNKKMTVASVKEKFYLNFHPSYHRVSDLASVVSSVEEEKVSGKTRRKFIR